MGDNLIDEFSPEIRDALFEVAENLLNTDRDLLKIQVDAGSKKGDNFVGIVYRITCSTEDDSRSKSLFIKIAPADPIKRKVVPVHQCFARESYVYDVVLPYFSKFQESRNVYLDGFHEFPKCYKTITTESIECLFLEDLAKSNFKMIDKDEITFEHILIVMKTLAKFHAVSFALKDQEPDKFAEITSNLEEVIFTRGKKNHFTDFINQAETLAVDCITEEDDIHLVKALLHLYETNQYDLIAELVESKPYSVVLHGDMWPNNIMFKYDDTEKMVQNIRFIDFQVSRYSSPVLDIMYFIFTSTTRELRGRNYNIYLKTYHETLSDLILRLGSDPYKVFPFKEFQLQLQQLGRFGILNASFALPVILKEVDFNPDSKTSRSDKNKKGPHISDSFKKRFRDIVSDSHRLGYI